MNNTNLDEININLVDIENQNMNISLELFDIVKQNAEEYCSYITKYKECTAIYFDKLSKLTYNIKKDNIILNKNLNISSIFSILNKIPKLVSIQIDGLKKFVESLDLTITPLVNVLKNEMNSLEKPKMNFEDNKKQYQKNMIKHKKLMDILSLTEKKIIKYYLSKKKQRYHDDEKNNMNAILKEAKFAEKDFLDSVNSDENYHLLFQDNCLKNYDEIKSHIRIILENLNTCVFFFLCVFNDCYSPCVNFIQNEIKIIKSEPINTIDIINDNLTLKTYKLEELPNDKYIIKLFNNPLIYKLSYSIDITNESTAKSSFSNIFNFFIKESDEINDDEILSNFNKIDLLGMAKKLYQNCKMISESNYDIKSEEEKINVKIYSDKLILMKKYKNKKMSENEKITYEEKKKLFELIKKKENGEIFLNRLNKIRSYGAFEYPKKIFDDILKIFLIILDELLISRDPFLMQFIIILSQTFYFKENGKKKYLYELINTHKVFHDEEMWKKLLEFAINQKTEAFNEKEYKLFNDNDEEYEQKMKKKIMDIVFAQLIAVVQNMVDYNFDIDKTEQIVVDYIKKYNLNESQEKLILDMINDINLDYNH